MKYWFFNGSDVVGPFTPKELTADKAFNADSLICPEFFSDEGDHWQPALSFPEFQLLLPPSPTEETPALTLEQEMDTLLQEKSPLLFEKTTTDSPGLQLPQKPAKPGPIEDYFNHIQKEDLGDILGIPSPTDNSDMDLAHALEKQLAKTSSTRRETQELSADEQTVQNLQPEVELPQAQQTHHVATATEVFATKAPLATAVLDPLPAVSNTPVTETLPPLPAEDTLTLPTLEAAPRPTYTPLLQPAVPQPEEPETNQPTELVPAPRPVETAPSTAAPAKPQQKETTAAPEREEAPAITPDPALLRTEKVEVNSINARLKQTQEMKDFLKAQTVSAKPASLWERKIIVCVLAVLVIIGAIAVLQHFHTRPAVAAPQTPAAVSTTAQELLSEPPTVHTPAAVVPPADGRSQALAIVQNYPLSGARGTLASYLNRIYQTQLAQGYTGVWEAEPLHKNTYLVKYRLTKTRKEPIIYIFQADVAAGKLTGALNNISLDLVGKIQ